MNTLNETQKQAVEAHVTKDGTLIIGRDGDAFRVKFPNGREWTMYYGAYYSNMRMKGEVA